MSKSQRTKGAGYEREVVALLNEYGADAERNLSQPRDGGYDIDSLFGAIECKRRSKLPKYLTLSENVRFAVTRADHQESYALVRIRDLCCLLSMERAIRSKIRESEKASPPGKTPPA